MSRNRFLSAGLQSTRKSIRFPSFKAIGLALGLSFAIGSAQAQSPNVALITGMLPVDVGSQLNGVLASLGTRETFDGMVPIFLDGLRLSSVDDLLLATDLDTLRRGNPAGVLYSLQQVNALLLKDLSNVEGTAAFLQSAIATGSEVLLNNSALAAGSP